MASLGFWNLLVIAAVTVILRKYWRGDRGTEYLRDSELLKYPLGQKILQFLRHPVVKILLQIVLILVIVRWLIYTGWVAYRLTQPEAPFWDFKFFYIVGVSAVQKLNVYSPDILSDASCRLLEECYQTAMVYPPNIIPFIWVLGLFSIESASTIWVSMHLIAITFILGGAYNLLESESRLIRTLCIVISALIYGLVFDLRVGNISSIIAALLIWAIILAKNGRSVAAGILLGISTIKPTICLLFIGYFLCKKKWKIVSISLAVFVLCFGIGLWISGISLAEFIRLYKVSYSQWNSPSIFPANNSFTSPTRIDVGVIGPRIFPQFPLIAELVSNLLRLIVALLIIQFIYQSQVIHNWTEKIYLSEVTLIGCLGILVFYSQRHNTAILVLAVPLLLNYLLGAIRQKIIAWRVVYLSFLGIFILLLTQTGIVYYQILEPLEIMWKRGSLPYLVKVTIGTLPNYTLIALTVIILLLARKNLLRRNLTDNLT